LRQSPVVDQVDLLRDACVSQKPGTLIDGLGGVLFAAGCDDTLLFRIDDPGNPKLTLVGDPSPEFFSDLAFRISSTTTQRAPMMGSLGLAALAILLIIGGSLATARNPRWLARLMW